MKNLTLCFAFFCSFSVVFSQGNKIISLPLTLEDGLGPFARPFGFVAANSQNPKNEWFSTYPQVKNIPNWVDVKNGQAWTDAQQFVYQNYHEGKISEERYHELQEDWEWKPDTQTLSKNPIHCYYCFAFGKKDGQNMFVLDANGNLDFSDDESFILDTLRNRKNEHSQIHRVQIEVFENQKITTKTLCLAVVRSSKNEDYILETEAQYWKAHFKDGTFDIDLVGYCGHFFTKEMEGLQLMEWNDTLEDKRVFPENTVKKGSFIHLSNDKFYHINGINPKTSNLELEEVQATVHIVSSQIGFIAPPFEAQELFTEKKISLADYKGKYVFLDFWGTWCKPCVQEIPNIKKLREAFGEDKLAIISVACNENSGDYIKSFAKSKEMNWLHIVDSNDEMTETYNITGFPTTILIDPNGKIVQMNLRGDKIVEYMKGFMK